MAHILSDVDEVIQEGLLVYGKFFMCLCHGMLLSSMCACVRAFVYILVATASTMIWACVHSAG